QDEIIAQDPGLYEKIQLEREQLLSAAEREARSLPASIRSQDEEALASAAEMKLEITNAEFIRRLPDELQSAAQKLAVRYEEKLQYAMASEYCRGMVNFDYFKMRCEVEQLKLATDARQAVRLADEFFVNAELEKARRQYELGWDKWAKIFDEYPQLMDDPEAEILRQSVANYESLLAQVEETIPADFKLHGLLQKYETDVNQLPEGFDPTGGINPQ
ncbi:MAG: hypothetical protein QGH11_13955, partial [Pirellulaceae bacterium]|nr:hypothetical protein [Pirellulaceae bacterium]